MIKLGFLMNLTFLLCIVITQALIWLLDGTILRTIIQTLNIKKMYAGMERAEKQNRQMQLLKNIEQSLSINIFQAS